MSKQENNRELLFIANPFKGKGLFYNGEFIGTKDLIDCSNNQNLKNFIDKNMESLETKDIEIHLGIDKSTLELTIGMREDDMINGEAYKDVDGEIFDTLGVEDTLSDAYFKLLEININEELKTKYILDLLKSQIENIIIDK